MTRASASSRPRTEVRICSCITTPFNVTESSAWTRERALSSTSYRVRRGRPPRMSRGWGAEGRRTREALTAATAEGAAVVEGDVIEGHGALNRRLDALCADGWEIWQR